MSKFQVILIGIFVVCIILGVILFATYRGSNNVEALPTITIWGTFSESTISTLIQQINNDRSTPISINYVKKSQASFDKDFIEALARGQGPDAILIPQDMMVRHADKITPIPINVLTERDFKNAYIAEAELYFTNSGTLAIPFTIDPLMMYWNRDIFTNAGLAVPPRYWDEFENIIKLVNLKDANGNIRRSALSLGEMSNISHSREVLSSLFIQAGNPITVRGNGIQSTLGNENSASTQAAVTFFTQYSNPRDKLYSWNRSLPTSKSWFLSGNLATYFGFASELFDIRAKNSNIDFDVAPFPQARNGKNRVTYGTMYGFSIVRTASDQGGTYTILQTLTSPDALSILNKITYLPPVRRDMIATGSTDSYQVIFYDSALVSKGWLDTNPAKSGAIFANLIENITSGRTSVYEAVQTAHNTLDLALQNP